MAYSVAVKNPKTEKKKSETKAGGRPPLLIMKK
jgi:hypothetical protein